jgi:ADP-ribose pyrophosphatase YjhB (NUDIX family)
MYKVFFNGHLLVLGNEIQNSFKDNIDQSIEIEEINDLIILLLKLEKVEYVVKLVISCKNGKNLFEMLSNSLTKITAAGGVVKNLQQEILFIKRLGRWDLPKGKTEQGESARQAAIREVEEECGIKSVIITRQLPCTYHIYRLPHIDKENNWVLKETSWFEMEYHGNDLPVPETKEQIEAVQWFSKRQLPVVLENTYGSLKDMISSYLA